MSLSRAAATIAGISLLPLLLSSALPALADDETIGSIKKTSGHAVVMRDGRQLPAHSGFKLHANDTLVTGPDGRCGIMLRDDSRLSLGPESRVAIEQFAFVPVEGKFGLTVRILRGTMAYVSGLIDRLAPKAATFVTPVATIGVRGTHFAARVAD